MGQAYFVTGTDTGIGKTFACCMMLRAAAVAGRKCAAMKPLAAGATQTRSGLRNDDALQLQRAASIPLSYEQINPVCLQQPASPHLAARMDGRSITISDLAGHCRDFLQLKADLLLIEGAGGWRVPVNESEMLSELAIDLNLPVVLVVGLRLGCLNHALLTVEAILRDGLRLAGWVANAVDEEFACREDNIVTLKQIIDAPLLADIPNLKGGAALEPSGYFDPDFLCTTSGS